MVTGWGLGGEIVWMGGGRHHVHLGPPVCVYMCVCVCVRVCACVHSACVCETYVVFGVCVSTCRSSEDMGYMHAQ